MENALGNKPVHDTDDRQPGGVRHLPHRASAGAGRRQDARPHLRADDLSGMGVQRLPHRRDAGRQAAARPGRHAADLPGLPYAGQGGRRLADDEQDRQHPGTAQLSGGRERRRARPRRPRRLCAPHAGRAERVPGQDGAAVSRRVRHQDAGSDDRLEERRAAGADRAGDARPGIAGDRDDRRRRRRQ